MISEVQITGTMKTKAGNPSIGVRVPPKLYEAFKERCRIQGVAPGKRITTLLEDLMNGRLLLLTTRGTASILRPDGTVERCELVEMPARGA